MAKRGVELKNDPFFTVMSKANPETVEEVTMQAEKTFEEVVRAWGERNGMVDEVTKMKEVARKLLRMGISQTEISLITDLDIETIKTL